MELNENRRRARSLLTYFDRVSGKSKGNNFGSIEVANFFSAKNMLLKVREIPLKIKASIRLSPSAVWKNLDEITKTLKELCEKKSRKQKLRDFEEQTESLENFLQMIYGGAAGAGESSGSSVEQQSQETGQGSSGGQHSQDGENGTSGEQQAEITLQNGEAQSELSDENQSAQEQSQQKQELKQSDENKQFLDALVDYFDETVPEEFKNQFTKEQKKIFDWICKQIGEERLEFVKKKEGLLLDTIKNIVEVIQTTDYSKLTKQFFGFNEKVNKAMTLNEIFGPFMNSFGIGMNEIFQENGFAELQKYGLILEKQKEIRELAEMLGHQESDDKEYEKNARDSVKNIESKYHPKRSFRGNIVGFTYSGDIGKVVPTEMALLKNPATEMLFYHKFAEKQLLSYDYVMNVTGEENKDKKRKKGPIIMAVDTSESMSGQPEKIAKIVAFAVTNIALKEKRKCFLISFSSDIKVLDLSDFSGGNGLKKLIDFLGHSFHGGTNIELCIDAALKKLEENDFTNADILVISDFEMYGFKEKTVQRIEKQKETGTRLFSLLIGSYQNKETLRYFDEQWTYNGNKSEKMTFIRELKNKL